MELLGPKPHNSRLGNCLPVSIRLSDEEKKKKKKKVESLGVRLSTFASFAIHTQKKKKKRKNVDRDTKPRPTNEPVTLYFYIYKGVIHLYSPSGSSDGRILINRISSYCSAPHTSPASL